MPTPSDKRWEHLSEVTWALDDMVSSKNEFLTAFCEHEVFRAYYQQLLRGAPVRLSLVKALSLSNGADPKALCETFAALYEHTELSLERHREEFHDSLTYFGTAINGLAVSLVGLVPNPVQVEWQVAHRVMNVARAAQVLRDDWALPFWILENAVDRLVRYCSRFEYLRISRDFPGPDLRGLVGTRRQMLTHSPISMVPRERPISMEPRVREAQEIILNAGGEPLSHKMVAAKLKIENSTFKKHIAPTLKELGFTYGQSCWQPPDNRWSDMDPAPDSGPNDQQ